MSLPWPRSFRLRHCGLRTNPRQKRRNTPLHCHKKKATNNSRIEKKAPSSGKNLASLSASLQLLNNHLQGGSLGQLLYDLPAPIIKGATAAVSDAVLGRSAPPSRRLFARRTLRSAIALAAVIGFILRLQGAVELAAQLDRHLERLLDDFGTDLELVSAVDDLLGPVVPPALPLRATMALASIVAFLVKLRTTSEAMAHLDFEHGVVAGVMSVLDLATSGPSLMKNCKELLAMGSAVDLAAAQAWSGGKGARGPETPVPGTPMVAVQDRGGNEDSTATDPTPRLRTESPAP